MSTLDAASPLPNVGGRAMITPVLPTKAIDCIDLDPLLLDRHCRVTFIAQVGWWAFIRN